MIGLAVGDALGAPVEFLSWSQIVDRYGPDGLAGPGAGSPLLYTDDTQMSLATAMGCLRASVRMDEKGIGWPPDLIYVQYLAWLKTQDEPSERRAPGSTCLSALRSGNKGSIEHPINDSKGCGGVMRTAPVGLAVPPGEPNGAFRIGAEAAALTHGHPSGYLPAGFLADLIACIVRGRSLDDAVDIARRHLSGYAGHEETSAGIQAAASLARGDRARAATTAQPSVASLGQGWLGDEALSIALYCALRYPNDWTAGVLAAANHSGDSDSTASICGAILGAVLGLAAIPGDWAHRVENSPRILKLADDMYDVFARGEHWDERPPD